LSLPQVLTWFIFSMSGNFELDLSNFARHVGQRVDEVTKEVVFELSAKLNEYSPVGDASYWSHPPPRGYVGGHFRANWQYGFNNKPSRELPGHSDQLPSKIGAQFPALTAGVHYLINNTPYGPRLEAGWSRQAAGPHAVVGRAVLDFQNIIRRAVGP
jgi:hypothetical protein